MFSPKCKRTHAQVVPNLSEVVFFYAEHKIYLNNIGTIEKKYYGSQ